MIVLRQWVSTAIVAAAVVDMLVFSHLTFAALVISAIGVAMMLIGLFFSYRPAAVLGMLVVTICAAAAMEIATLLTVGNILSALAGLVLPASVLAWLALSAEEQVVIDLFIARKPFALTAVYAASCIVSVAIFVLLLGLVSPALPATITVVTESAIMLVCATLLGLALTWRGPGERPIERGEEE